MSDFDLIVIGTGVAGRTAAEDASKAGLRVALADCREFGGTCALRGCEPKKVLVAAAEVVERVRAQAANGIAGDAHLDWRRLVEFKRTFTEPLPAMFERSFAAMGVTLLHGVARFTSPGTLEVGGAVHSARSFLVATGAIPAPLGIEGEELVIDSERFMESESLPPRIVFIGGGYISFEFAALARAAGSDPVIVHRGPWPLELFDRDLVGLLLAHCSETGIDIRLDSPVTAVVPVGSELAVVLADGSEVRCDMVVHGAGRVPDLAALRLDVAGVAAGRHGVEVDHSMASISNPAVYAAGDAAALGAPLTPVATAQARVAVCNIVAPGSAVFDRTLVPSIVFCDPPLASVGLSEAAAREDGIDVAIRLVDTSGWLSSQRVGLHHTGAKTLVDRRSGRVLGAHLLCHNADELINLFALAIERGATVGQLKAIPWGYPTASSEIVYLL